MAPLPKRRHSTRRQGKRRFSHSVLGVTVTRCKECGSSKNPRYPCPNCGYRSKNFTIDRTKKV